MDFLGNYVCAFYPWCLFATPLLAGVFVAAVEYTKGVNWDDPNELFPMIVAAFVLCFIASATMPFWPILIFGPISYFLTKFLLGKVSISFKKD